MNFTINETDKSALEVRYKTYTIHDYSINLGELLRTIGSVDPSKCTLFLEDDIVKLSFPIETPEEHQIRFKKLREENRKKKEAFEEKVSSARILKEKVTDFLNEVEANEHEHQKFLEENKNSFKIYVPNSIYSAPPQSYDFYTEEAFETLRILHKLRRQFSPKKMHNWGWGFVKTKLIVSLLLREETEVLQIVYFDILSSKFVEVPVFLEMKNLNLGE